MDRRTKLELFEEIRREYTHGAGTIQGVSKKLGVHRRMVRQALASATPLERNQAVRSWRVAYPCLYLILPSSRVPYPLRCFIAQRVGEHKFQMFFSL